MAEVLRCVSFRLAGTHWQNGLGAFQGLNLTLYVHAKHQCLFRRAYVKANHIATLST